MSLSIFILHNCSVFGVDMDKKKFKNCNFLTHEKEGKSGPDTHIGCFITKDINVLLLSNFNQFFIPPTHSFSISHLVIFTKDRNTLQMPIIQYYIL